MGLRIKIISLFFIGFGLMAVIAIVLLYTNLQEGFVEIERKQGKEQMELLTVNLNSELDRLNQMSKDWGNWDDTYAFIQHPGPEFIDHQIGPEAMQTVGLKFVTILNNKGVAIASNAIDTLTGKRISSAPFDNVVDNVRRQLRISRSEKPCGFDVSSVGPVFLCWQAIHKTDHSGKEGGTIIMTQLMDKSVLKRIQDQSNLKFELLPISDRPPKSTGDSEIDNHYLYTQLKGISGEPILNARLKFSRDVSQEGDEIIGKIIRVLLLVTVLTGLTLLVGVHFLVIRRLRRMETELDNIWRNARWTGNLDTKNGKDELNELAHSINRMLALIRKQMHTLESIAHTDSLTRIANRRSFDNRLAIEMSQHKRNHTPVSLIIIDVDYFKRYNDYYGHPAGDEILKEIGKVLSTIASRPSDLPARIGGEEFAVLLPATELDGACFVAEKINNHLAELKMPHADSPVSNHVTISMGVTVAGDEDVANFVQRADKATYNAKQTGRNKICVLPATTYFAATAAEQIN